MRSARQARSAIEPLVPEQELGPGDVEAKLRARRLLETADFIYDGIWEAFLTDFGLSLKEIATERGQIFANFRTAVISTSGLANEVGGDSGQLDSFERFRFTLQRMQRCATRVLAVCPAYDALCR